MLMDHTDLMIECVLRRTDFHLFSVDEDLTLVGIVNPGNHIHQRRFAAPVFTENGKDLSITKIKVHVLVRNDLTELFGDSLELQRKIGFHSVSCLKKGTTGQRFFAPWGIKCSLIERNQSPKLVFR